MNVRAAGWRRDGTCRPFDYPRDGNLVHGRPAEPALAAREAEMTCMSAPQAGETRARARVSITNVNPWGGGLEAALQGQAGSRPVRPGPLPA